MSDEEKKTTAFYVDEENGVVVSKFTDKNAAVRQINQMIRSASNYLIPNPTKFYATNSGFFMEDSYSGKCVCGAEDTFDEEFGKNLAKNRMYVKVDNAINRRVFNMLEELKKAENELTAYLQNHNGINEDGTFHRIIDDSYASDESEGEEA